MTAVVKLATRTLRDVSALAAKGLVRPDELDRLAAVEQRYAVAITPELAALIDRTDPADPIARQFVPDARELVTHPAERADPIGDHDKSPVKGIVHRYPDRVLLKVVGVCPVYCRFCFRREMVGPEAGVSLSREEIVRALDYVRQTPAVREVIVTGGDPWMLAPDRIAALTREIAAIPTVVTIRWHTRMPVARPARITSQLVDALAASGRSVVVAVHVNHPRELTPEARTALLRLADTGVHLLSQSVLLRGVNDDTDTLVSLFRALVTARVKPYYLHHGDLAPGTSHFRVPLWRGQEIMAELRRRLSGIAIPAYVLDIPGGYGKVPVDGTHTRWLTDGVYEVIDAAGRTHRYADACS